MTPLLGTKNPSAPVGDAPAGDGRAARSLLSCALWRGMGRLWRGMGRPEPLSAHRRRRQQGLSGFHETRDTGLPGAPRGVPSGPARMSEVFTKHETRDTNHGFYRRTVAAFLRVVARCGAAMARHERHGAPRAAVRAPSAPATGPFRFSRNTRHGFAWRAARGALWPGANSEVFTKHETRDTNHGLYAFPESRHLSPHGRCFPARCGATAAPLWRGYGAAVARVGRLWRWRGMGGDGAAWAAVERHGRQWSGMGGILPPRQCPRSRQPFSVGLTTGLHVSPRGEVKYVRGPSDISSGANQAPSHGFHESRITRHESRPFFACFDRRVLRHAG